MPDRQPVTVERLTAYDPSVAAGLGLLMPHLDDGFSGEPIPQARLERLLANPNYTQLVAFSGEAVVGAATMNIIGGAGRDFTGQLEDFVVDPNIRRAGVGRKLWSAMLDWCADEGLPGFELSTETYRTEAIAFYIDMDARLIAGTDTHYAVSARDAA